MNKTIGIVLIIIGVLMFAFNSFHFQTDKTVVDMGPLKIDKTEDHSVGWPSYAGGIAALVGVVLVIADRKKN